MNIVWNQTSKQNIFIELTGLSVLQEEQQANVPSYGIYPNLTAMVASHFLSILSTTLSNLEVRVPIPQSTSVSIVRYSPEVVIVPQGVSLKHPTHVLWNLNQGRTLANPFE
ncbi:hypothetical protein TNCV_1735231 [Trichonephila clavipes]|nr:hypothetical protein TNCV_1735231 [Trichonephila clavipes]